MVSYLKICVIANVKHVEMYEKDGDNGLPYITQDQLKALKKKKAELKKIVITNAKHVEMYT